VRLRDVARTEIGAADYTVNALLNNQVATAIVIFQRPGSNALETAAAVRRTMEDAEASFPSGIGWSVVYDPTRFIAQSMEAVLHTFAEAVALVVLVVVLFLQNWRAAVIPLLAIPVSIVGTFAVLLALGFTLNALTMFGFILAIGIVVDDAIVVVENAERHMAEGMSPWRRRAAPWTRSASRWSPSRWCWWPCSCRPPSSPASPAPSTGSSRRPSPSPRCSPPWCR
jgi:HAE1 family hydrophobic/amphiphilic exporter-1